ncbi:hypothetical protein HF288_05630, partial [Acidithiobacillus caldus]
MTETVVVAGFILVPLLILGVYVGKWAYLQDRTIEAARYAAWERTVSPLSAPKSRDDWVSLKSEDDLANEVRLRFFGGRNERITAVTGSAGAAGVAKGSSPEPLLRKHDGEPLLIKREGNITVKTREEAFDGGWAAGAMGALSSLAGSPLPMTGPTVAAVTVSATGLPQRIFSEVGLGDPLQFKAQAAVLTDPWSGSPDDEKRIVESLIKPQRSIDSTVGNFFRGLAQLLNGLSFGLFSEAGDLNDKYLYVDTNLQ